MLCLRRPVVIVAGKIWEVSVENFVEVVRHALREVGYVANEHLAAQVALLLCQNNGAVRAMLLDGPPGAGKTFLSESVATLLGAQHVYVQAHPGSTPEDFLYDVNIVQILKSVAGDATAVQSAEDVVNLGFLPMVFRLSQQGPVVALVDELDKSSPKVDSLFLSALQTGEVIVKGIGAVKANLGNVILFFTKNGERMVSEPLMRRCRRVYMDFPGESLELDVVMGRVAKGSPEKPLTIRQFPLLDRPESLAKLLITAANKMRRQEMVLKPPCTQEVVQAMDDTLRLKSWGVAVKVRATVVLRWLAAYQEDYQLACRLFSGADPDDDDVPAEPRELERLLPMARG